MFFLYFMSLLFMCIKQKRNFFKKKYIPIILINLYERFFVTRIRLRCLKWIRIRPKDTDPAGSGSETLVENQDIGTDGRN